MGALIMAFHKI